MTAYAAALSEHPDLAAATAEAVGTVLEQLDGAGAAPDVAFLFVTPPHRHGLEEAAAAVRETLGPHALVGCAAESVVGGRREVERTPAVSLWAGYTGQVTPFHLTAARTPDGLTITGWPEIPPDASGMVVLADPYTFPTDLLLRRMEEDHRGLPLVGGMAMASTTAGQNRLLVDGEVVSQGAVGVLLGPSVSVATLVSQGCRPVGHPFVVTRAEGDVVYELAGRPALERLGDIAEAMPEDERMLLYRGVHLGRVIDERKAEFGRGDFLIRGVMGGDQQSGAIQVGDQIEVGSTTQFQVRDADAADEDLRQMVAGLRGPNAETGERAQAALLFTCNGRGVRLFGSHRPDHDASVLTDGLGGAPVAGMFCAGEIGPVGGRNFLHGFTASVLLISPAT